jgi:hypothetical protein
VDLAHSETVEAELNRLIERHSSREMDPDEREELRKESVRVYTARKREAKKEPAKDRQYRQNRQPPEEVLQNEQKQTDNADGLPDGPDGTYTEDRQNESPANSGSTDGSDGTDEDRRQNSKEDSKEDGSWQSDPMRHYGQGGTA